MYRNRLDVYKGAKGPASSVLRNRLGVYQGVVQMFACMRLCVQPHSTGVL
jgi:hypothetical protein